MDFVRGRTLESYILRLPQQGAFDLTRQKLSIAIQLANALDYLRAHRLIHRDVKPANVFLSRPTQSAVCWTVRLGDFGVMKWGDFQASIETGTLTVTSQRGLGTLKYMSPEQAVRPKDVTVKSDIYSLGITLYELFTGQVLASAHHVYEVANARRSRGNTVSRFFSLGFHLRPEDEPIGELLLDMFLAPTGRPPIDHIRGRLEWEYERRFGGEWEYDLY
jgi:serine/threonine-protein kinase